MISHIFVLLFSAFSVHSILLYQRFEDIDCSEPYFEYGNNRTLSTTFVKYCSNNFPLYKESVGFEMKNTTHIELFNFEEFDCDDTKPFESMHVIRIDSCEYDVVGIGDVIIDGYMVVSEVNDFPSRLLEIPSNELGSVRYDEYNKRNCQNRSLGFTLNHGFFPTNVTNQLLLPNSAWYFRKYSNKHITKQVGQLRCNESRIHQYVKQYNDGEQQSSNIIEEISLFVLSRNTQGHPTSICYPGLTFWFGETQSYTFQCSGESFSNFPNHKRYRVFENYWNDFCYGASYRISENPNAACMCFEGHGSELFGSYICHIRYIIQNQRLDVIQIRDEPSCVDPRITSEFDVIRSFSTPPEEREDSICIEAYASDECGFGLDYSIDCHMIGYETDSRVLDETTSKEYFLTITHNESCDYVQQHPSNFERKLRKLFLRENEMEINPTGISYFHPTLCMSDLTTGVESLGVSSFYVHCSEEGTITITYYNNSHVCDVERPVEDDKPVTKTVIEGDSSSPNFYYCEFVEKYHIYFYLLCKTIYCGMYAQYDHSRVCSGNGYCIQQTTNSSIGKCICNKNYEGENCEIRKYEEITNHMFDDDDNGNEAAVVVPAVVVPLVFIIFIICCCCCCFGIFCFGFCCLICCLCCFICNITGITVRQRKRLSKYGELRHIDILLEEQRLDEDQTIAKLRINKSLFEIPYDEIQFISILGSGGSDSIVYKSHWRTMIVAFKSFKTSSLCSSQENFDEFEKEVSMLSSLSHPHTIRFYGASLKPPRVGIVMEFCENGEIIDFISKFRKRHNKGYPIFEKLRLSKEILSALEYCHSRSLIHRDLKGENVLLDGKQTAKLMDFGLSRLVQNSYSKKTKRVGTNCYMAPEILIGEYNERVDCFSMAILLYAIFSEKKRPYNEESGYALEVRVANDPNFRPDLQDLRKQFELESYDGKWIENVIQRCWKHDPKERYSSTQLTEIFEKGGVVDDNHDIITHQTDQTEEKNEHVVGKSKNDISIEEKKDDEEIESIVFGKIKEFLEGKDVVVRRDNSSERVKIVVEF